MKWCFVPIFLGLFGLVGWLAWLGYRILILKDPEILYFFRRNKDK